MTPFWIVDQPRTDFWFLLLLVVSICELITLISCYKWGAKWKDKYDECHQSLLNKGDKSFSIGGK